MVYKICLVVWNMALEHEFILPIDFHIFQRGIPPTSFYSQRKASTSNDGSFARFALPILALWNSLHTEPPCTDRSSSEKKIWVLGRAFYSGKLKKSGKKHGNMFKHPFEKKHERNLLLTICRIVGGQRWTRPRKRALRLATPGVKWRKSERLHWTRSLRLPGTRKSFGSSIPKTGSFQYKPTILGYPHSRNTPYDYYDMFNYIYIYRYNISVVYGRL